MANEYVIFDVETTGMRPESGDAIVEIAAQRIEGRQVVGTFNTLVNPGKKMNPEVIAIHGITNEMVATQGRSLIEVIPAFLLFSEGATLVAHNISFDLNFLNWHLKVLGLPPITNPTLDTLELSKSKVMLASYSLKYLAQHFQIPQPTAHRALADVETTRELLFKLLDLQKIIA